MSFSLRVQGIDKFNEALQNVARAVGPPHMAEGLRHAAKPILHKAQENLLEQELYDTGALYDAIKIKVVNQYAVEILVDSVYGAVHEFGYTGVITDRQRRFFWAKYAETEDEMWKALALSYSYTIPARPYLRPAIDSEQKQSIWEFTLYMSRVLTEQLGIRS